MTNIKGLDTMTLSVAASETYVIKYRSSDMVDVLNATDEDITVETNVTQAVKDAEDNSVGTTAITLPAGVACNNLELRFGTLTITPTASGSVVIVRH